MCKQLFSILGDEGSFCFFGLSKAFVLNLNILEKANRGVVHFAAVESLDPSCITTTWRLSDNGF